MKSIIQFLEASFRARCRIAIMADEHFVRRNNLLNLEIHLLGHPQIVWGSKTEGKQSDSINSNKNQVINLLVSKKN